MMYLGKEQKRVEMEYYQKLEISTQYDLYAWPNQPKFLFTVRRETYTHSEGIIRVLVVIYLIQFIFLVWCD